MRWWMSWLLLLCAFGCASRGSVKVKSVPDGAAVTMYGRGGGVRSLGKTPLEIPASELSGGRFASLVVTKEGFKDHLVLLAQDKGSESYDISLNLQAVAEDPKVTDARARQEKLAKLLLQAHALTAAKKYLEAERVLGGVVQDYPYISAGYDLLGNVAYLQKDLKTALGHYERSLQLNPENAETRQMVDKLTGMLR